MAKLIAARSILYLNNLYEGGEQLPYYDKATVDAWVEAGSAKWVEDSEKKAAEDKPQLSSSTPEPEKDAAPVGRAVKKRAGKG